MEDPQSAVGFLKKLNPADIAAIFITCGVDDLKAKLEKLEQVINQYLLFEPYCGLVLENKPLGLFPLALRFSGNGQLVLRVLLLAQVSFDCSVEYYETEARRYKKQTQVTFKGDRSQTSAFHVYQVCVCLKLFLLIVAFRACAS